jgi:hypothetical protein
MKTENSICKSESCILIERPASGDAEFNGHWLLSAAKADELLQQAKRDDSQFCKAITDLEESEFMDFGLSAEWFLSQMAANKGFQTFVIEACSANAFVIMAETGFFALTGDHYQMTLPSNLDMGRVKQADLKLAETEDEDCLYPELLLVAMPYSQATKYQRLLRAKISGLFIGGHFYSLTKR